MLDELRKNMDEDFDFEEDETSYGASEDSEEKVDRLFMGMTAVERMLLSIFLFMNVTVLGLAFLIATRRIVF